jgi:hypothetical protein
MGKQLGLNLYKGTWGGRRLKCGRKRIHSRGVQHRTREAVDSKKPLHVNFKYKFGIRNKEFLKSLKKASIKK